MITRRNALQIAGAAALAGGASDASAQPAGRLKQSAARWCYKNYSIDDLAKHCKEIGLKGVDLVDEKDWPVVQKYGLVSSMVYSAGTIPHGFNRLENHDELVKKMEEGITNAAAAGCPNVITFAGNRAGLADDKGIENCVTGLNRCKKFAEDKKITINLELLNSKIDHHDYQCDHTAWGVAVMKGVDSPRVKLLYDIYHMQIMEGDIIRTIRDNIKYIGHFHTGGVPGRHELDGTQELDWHAVAKAIADADFQGFVAHEFVPVNPDAMKSLQQAYQTCLV